MKKEPIQLQSVENINSIIQIEFLDASGSTLHTPPGYHFHNSLEIVILERGSVELMVNCMLQKIEKGSVVVFGSDLPHGPGSYSADSKGVLIHIPQSTISWCAPISELQAEMEYLKSAGQGYLYTSDTLYRKAVSISRKIKRSLGFQKIGYLFELLHALIKEQNARQTLSTHCLSSVNKHNSQSNLEKVYDYLYSHFQDNFSLDDLSKHIGINRSALCRSFKKQTGYTLFEFTNRLRIEKACGLLRSSDMSVSQIAFQVGFNTFSHFSTQFSRIVNLTPTEYREKVNL